ncbi:hypothetical protein GCM10007301_15320 [Azorhizobium oxalatiphilum]|uniref:Uncharacterized protein n=1 Tax=Azorhizobium oxalatiphilum TaxID=980631 RepID=A0A917BS24_9HYPH|nr:hypothetical protein [Azorhizobium oxalatiphilum]GGF56578.1 hypothetical protein GCM10007301_15320 [Azorhizobium oxalatiphilum]
MLVASERIQVRAFQLAGEARSKATDQFDLLGERQKGLEVQASHLKAKSRLGAIYQIHLILSAADLLRTCVAEGSGDALTADEDLSTIKRMCHSVRAYLEQDCEESAHAVGSDYYMPHACDPHQLIEDALYREEGGHAD